jgi:predicted transposase/invertase (TIGR01784 family)
MNELKHPIFINPFTDFGFKKIFGEEANKDILISFLNELLAMQGQHIETLTYKKTHKLGKNSLDRNVVFDLYCENQHGEKFTVELQKAKQAYFKDRMLYYSSFSIQEQGIKGDWNYQLKAVYVIGILDFIMDENNADKIVVSRNQLTDIERDKVFYDKLTFITLQMPNFDKQEHELETNFDKWLYVIKNLHRLEQIPERVQDKIFEKVFKVAQFSALNKEEREKYEDSLKYYNDLKNSLDTAFEEGKEEGKQESLQLLEQAKEREADERRQKEEAIQKGKIAQQKEIEAKLKLAQKMLKYGEPVEEIIKETGLSGEEIEKLR